jgi:hypothetical protein
MFDRSLEERGVITVMFTNADLSFVPGLAGRDVAAKAVKFDVIVSAAPIWRSRNFSWEIAGTSRVGSRPLYS